MWHDPTGLLFWLDIPTGILRAYQKTSGNVSMWDLGRNSAGLTIDPGTAELLVGQQMDVLRFDMEHTQLTHFDSLPEGDAEERLNDLEFDPAGSLWAATMDGNGRRPLGRLLRRSPAGTWQVMLDGLPIVNGPAFNRDGTVGYLCDTVGRSILRFAPPPIGTSSPLVTHPFVRFSTSDGFPDGVAVDRLAHLWVAHYGGGCVTRWSPDGRCVVRVSLPVPNPTSVALGPDALYITSAANDAAGDAEDAGGALFVHHLHPDR